MSSREEDQEGLEAMEQEERFIKAYEDDEDGVDDLLGTEDPFATYGAILHLSYLRSSYLVGQALATACPSEADWQALLRDPLFVESIGELAVVLADIRAGGGFEGEVTPEAVEAAAGAHYGRSLEAVVILAERLAVPEADLLAVLVHAM